MSPHPAAVALALCAVAPLSGCCTLARLFCGPDRSPWVPISCETPRATLQTFLEAVRRDSPAQAYQCLARSFLERNHWDVLVLTAFWQELHRQQPGLHLFGYAELPER